MSIAQALPLADTWGSRGDIGTGWVIVMAVMMMLCMGAMMFGMGRMGRGFGRSWPAPWERFMTRETPVEILDRRFAEGAISFEDYEQRRQQLTRRTARQTEPPADAQPPPGVDAT